MGAILGAGLLAATLPLWWRRDTAALLACATLAALAFYFLPTRAHERYLFPMFALALPLAASRSRVFVPYATLALAFFGTLYYAFTRYQQYVDLRVPALIECGASAVRQVATRHDDRPGRYVAWRLVCADARPNRRRCAGLPGRGTWTLPAGLGRGRLPTRRDVAVAALVALAVLGTRGYRLDWPREMYFDEVYHARTAFELLAHREPYEWTHPHLAKEIMALGILGFGDDRVAGHEPAPPQGTPKAFAVANDGTRVWVTDRFEIVVRAAMGPRPVARSASMRRRWPFRAIADCLDGSGASSFRCGLTEHNPAPAGTTAIRGSAFALRRG